MERTALRRDNGEVFVVFERMPGNTFILAQWVGMQSLETVRQGGTYFIHMLQQQACPKLLNSHKDLIGTWTMATEWAEVDWTPQVRALGLRYMAQVLAPGVYGQMSYHQLHPRIEDKLEIRMFGDERSARQWLLQLPI
jgi:hypothetical protein